MKLFSREISAIAFPAIISNITTPLLAMVDMAIVGHIGNATYIGAVAIGASMFNMLYWLFGFLRMGSSGLTSQAYGRGDRSDQGLILHRALAISLLSGFLLIALSSLICNPLLDFMDADTDTRSMARTYFLLAVCGAPATLSTYALTGWFLGMQDSRTPMWVAIATNIINIAVSLVLVFGCCMKIKGVAIGSASAQWCGFIIAAVYAFRHYRPARPSLKAITELKSLRKFFSINLDIFLRTLCLVSVTVWFTKAGSSQSVTILAANAVLLQLFMFFSYFMDGFAFAAEALAGKYAGRRDNLSLRQTISRLNHISIALALIFSTIYILFGNFIVGLLTDDPDVRQCCLKYLWWAAAVPIAGTTAFVYDGILIGLTRTRLMLLAMAAAMAIFFAIYFSTRASMANHGLWLSFIVYLAVRGLIEASATKSPFHSSL